MACNNSIGVVLCGLGRMGMIHMENILKNRKVKLLYIIEEDAEKADRVISEECIGDTTKRLRTTDIQEALSDDRVDAFIIATPTHTHSTFLNLALSAGKHVLCEKPLATELKDVMASYEMAKSKDLVLLCAFSRRFDPQIQQFVKAKDRIGKLQTVKICSRDTKGTGAPIEYLKTSGSVFHDSQIHDVDLMRWIVGENPETMYVTAHCHDPQLTAVGDVDTVFTTMKFPSGVLALIETQRSCAYGYHQTVEMYGTEGNLVSSNPRKSNIVFNDEKERDDIYESFADRYAEAYRNEIKHFVELIQNKEIPLLVSETDTLYATLMSQTAEDSWRDGRVIDVKIHFEKLLRENGL